MITLLLAILALHTSHPRVRPHPHHDVCPGATYFYERHHPAPYWAKNMIVVCTIQNHIFLKEKPRGKS